LKNQYFGDEDDFKKYGILRELSKVMSDGMSVCWMLTSDDGTGEGSDLSYLEKTWEWRNCDPDLFDYLNRCISNGKPRNVGLLKEFIRRPPIKFFDRPLPDDLNGRVEYFEDFKKNAGNGQFVFFDPDIGLAPVSVIKGNAGSSRYLFWDELSSFYFNMKQSILVYQHFPRVNRNQFVCDAVSKLMLDTRAPSVYTLRTNRVVFFLLPQSRHAELIETACRSIARKWNRHIEVWKHHQPTRLM